MLTLRNVISLFVFTALIFFHGLSFSEEKMENAVTPQKAEDTILVFSTQGLDKDALNALMSENLPVGAFIIGEKDGKTVAVRPKTSTELTSVKGVTELTGAKDIPNISYLTMSLKTVMKAFKSYKVDQIEVWVTAIAETGVLSRIYLYHLCHSRLSGIFLFAHSLAGNH